MAKLVTKRPKNRRREMSSTELREIERKPARTPEDWDEQEREEEDSARPKTDEIDEILKSPVYKVNASNVKWVHPKLGQFRVARFYWGKGVAFEFADQEEVCLIKKEVLNSLGIVYIYVLPGKPTNNEEFAKSIEDQRASFKKAA